METKKRGRPAKAKEEAKPAENEIEIFRLFIISKCPNPRWLRAMKEDRSKAYVEVPSHMSADRIVGKWVSATKIDGSEENQYTFHS